VDGGWLAMLFILAKAAAGFVFPTLDESKDLVLGRPPQTSCEPVSVLRCVCRRQEPNQSWTD